MGKNKYEKQVEDGLTWLCRMAGYSKGEDTDLFLFGIFTYEGEGGRRRERDVCGEEQIRETNTTISTPIGWKPFYRLDLIS